ncbi:MAG: SIS domain-containing protein [Ignavibacteriales bacterium]|nr:SIS domain-containing protein [Ignavibacteriales bacterium]
MRTRTDALDGAGQALAAAARAGRMILVFGNGGSAAEAQHFAAELVNGLVLQGRAAPVAAVALTTDTSCADGRRQRPGISTASSAGRSRPWAGPGMSAVALTTSGALARTSLEALRSARAKGLVDDRPDGRGRRRGRTPGGSPARRALPARRRASRRRTSFILHFLADLPRPLSCKQAPVPARWR